MSGIDGRILHDDGDVVAVDKWPGIPSTGRSLDDPDCVQWHLMEREGAMVWAVHQLDADTSGVLLFTRRRGLVAPIKAAMASPEATKRYVAVVDGRPDWGAVTAIGAIGPTRDGGELWVAPGGRAARTDLRMIERGKRAACVGARIRTGRTHQVRIHLAALGHPLLGEEWYVRPACRRHARQALHAHRLTLPPPFELDVWSPLAPDLVELMQREGLGPERCVGGAP